MLQSLQFAPSQSKGAGDNAGDNHVVDGYVHLLFERQAACTPDAPAVSFGDRRLTYAQLNRRANRLAWHLRQLGVGPDSLVAVYMDRSVDLIVAFLGILKAGGAYVPVDPAYPAERLTFMLEDTACGVVITQSHLIDTLPASPAHLVCLGRDAALQREDGSENLPACASPENLAYLMYTSGSTGRPKGVCIRHRGVVRLVVGQDYFSATPADRFLQSAPISFDASTFEIWGALLHGAELVLFPDRILGIDTLETVIRTARISTLWLTPSVFNPLIDEDPHILGPVRQLILGGEPLSPRHVHRALSVLPDLQIVNGYGPTENSDFTCCYRVPKTFAPEAKSVPVGRALRGDEIYIVDKDFRQVAAGEPGELCVSGAGLARGYHRRPRQTARSFIPNPFSSRPGSRLYRTRDLARVLQDGTIELLGRTDDQVKIRGFRIELGEVEAALLRHPDARQAAVMVRKDASGADILVAYVALGRGCSLTITEVREFLSAFLPQFMLPSALVCVDAIPLNPHGKTDRKALPDLVLGPRPELAGRYIAPKGDMERLVAAIWSEALGVTQVGALDNFFDLGGTSLLTRQVQLNLMRSLQRDIPATSLFEYVTVRALAGFLSQHAGEPAIAAEAASGSDAIAARVRRRLEIRKHAMDGGAG
jgi:amino acid adenylation domain-containing protein